MEKTCSRCKSILPFSSFNRKKDSKDGFAAYCRSCDKEYKKEWYKKNKTLILEKRRAYRENNKESINAKNRSYYHKNKECILAKQKAYYEKNKTQILERDRQKKAYKLPKVREYLRFYANKNRARIKKYKARWYQDHVNNVGREAVNKRSRELNKRRVLKLSDSYVKGLLSSQSNLKNKDIPEMLVEAKRFQLLIKREIKNE